MFKDHQGEIIHFPLAGWAVIEGTKEEGDTVIGMVSAMGGGDNNSVMPGICRLVTVPPVLGSYKHKNELDQL